MGQITIKTCDLCECVIAHKPAAAAKVTFGYSMGGWGFRNNLLDKTFDGLCAECWGVVQLLSEATSAVLEQRKGINAPEVIVRPGKKWADTVDNLKRLTMGVE